MSFNVIFRKKPFPDSEIGHSKEMRKRGIICASEAEKILWRKKNKKVTKECDDASCIGCSEFDSNNLNKENK